MHSRLRKSAAMIAVGVVLSCGAALAQGAPQPAPFSFADLAERLSPAVVNVSTTQLVERRRDEGEEFDPEQPFEDWFREFGPDGQDGEQQPRRRRQTSLGSGFVIDPSGYVVTNNHVVEGADQISVILPDDSVLEAKLVGRDEKTDLALLKVEPKAPLPAVPWGDSDRARVGDWVIAIGNPFGLGGSVTTGIISARARDISQGNYDDFLQTDAAINRGNSGGPLFNLAGEVIGINTAIYSSTGTNVGVGFATSSNLAQPIIRDLRAYGRTRRGWLGVQIQSVIEDTATSLGLPAATGALVATVTKGSPADKAGILSGDVILSFDGKSIDRMRSLPRIVAETEIGKSVTVEIFRKGARKTLQAKVAELEDEPPAVVASISPLPRREMERTELNSLGLTVIDLTDRVRERFDIPEGINGIVVVDVDDDSDAAEKGLRRGDVIDEIQQMQVATAADAEAALAAVAARKVVLLRVQSGENIRFVGVKVAESTAESSDDGKPRARSERR
ncbi:MAG: Do family serine endopeptidase [Rhodospirillaceae bacterium]|nr:Do family serine endopeptidase [Rhodospirillaceae bacterium]